jgi:hypothetical protein
VIDRIDTLELHCEAQSRRYRWHEFDDDLPILT